MEYEQLITYFMTMYEEICTSVLYKGILISVGVILALLLCDSVIRAKMRSNSDQHLFFRLLDGIRYPALLSLLMVGFLLFLKSIAAKGELETLILITEVVLIACIGWILIRMIRTAENHYAMKGEYCAFTTHVLATVARSILLLVVGLMILDKLGVNIGGILAVGGIGGIVLGLASKDLFANFFGFVTIILDRPFKVGDLVSSTDRDIRGVVDKITWRVTRVITLEKKPMYIPNSIFSTIVIQNESDVLARRIDEILKFEFQDHGMISEFTEKVTSFLADNTLLNHKFKATFDVNKIGTDVIAIGFIGYTKAKTWDEFSSARQKILLEIFAIAKDMGLKIMYPETQICLYDNR